MQFNNENCYEYFIQKVRKKLHMILCFSPVGEAFRVRARRFPALVNNTVIDWFHPWPADALQSVSERFLDEVELGTDEVKEAITEFMPFSFVVVNDASKVFLREQKRYNYTTPKSFLELIALYKSMLQKKRDSLTLMSDRLQGGLDKLQGTAKAVGELEEFLKVKAVEVEAAIASAGGEVTLPIFRAPTVVVAGARYYTANSCHIFAGPDREYAGVEELMASRKPSSTIWLSPKMKVRCFCITPATS